MTEYEGSLGRHRQIRRERLSRYTRDLSEITEEGNVGNLNTHQVTAANLEMLGQILTTVGVGLRNAAIVRAHAAGEPLFTPEQRIRSAVLHVSAKSISDVFDDQTARVLLRSSAIALSDDERKAAIAVIEEADIDVLRGPASLLHGWMEFAVTEDIGDQYED